MAEQYKKIYITVREFISSWEKEIYELNNLDYFIFILINQLGHYIQKECFGNNSKKDNLYLDDNEISSLVFNIGDTLQYFMEKNCYDTCPFHCPINMKDKVTPNEVILLDIFPDRKIISSHSCKTKEDCFYMEIFNNVVLESLFDFYNYDKGIVFEETDTKFLKFASLIVDHILELVNQKGAELLTKPFDNTSALFEELLASTEDIWDFQYPHMEDDDEDEELWKVGPLLITNILDEYILKFNRVPENNNLSILNKFKIFLVDFLGLQKITEINEGDFQEFLAIHFFHDLVIEQKESAVKFIEELKAFFQHIDYHYNITLTQKFNTFINNEIDNIERNLKICHDYFRDNSFVEFMLSAEYTDETLNEGFFEIIEISGNKFIVQDIHLGTKLNPVILDLLPSSQLVTGDILHIQLMEKDNTWQMVSLEMIYPAFAKIYLI